MNETTIQIPGVITADLGNGAKLVQGPKGDDGASAYEQAVEGGYTGTEEEFKESLATIDTKATAASTAADAAEAAQDAAETAQAAAELAKTAAVQSETNARNSAGGAQQSAEAAGTAKTAAEKAAEEAEGSATAASGSATAAASSATNAANSATTAAEEADDAADSADAASGAATAAAGAASSASGAATAAAAARDAIVNMELDVTTLAPDADATASGALVDGKYVLSLGIPQGQKGDRGNRGLKGETGVSITGVVQTGGNHAAGTLDTYTINFSDDTSTTFQIYNGANGEGSGDFMANGTVPMTGDLNMNSHKVTGVATPTADTDATPKAYVDSAVEARIPNTQKGQAGGVATLDDSGKVPAAQLPSMDYVPNSQKGAAGGVATLDSSGKVPSAQLPSMDYIPTSQKGAASGVAELDSTGRVPSSQLPSYVDDVLEFSNKDAFPAIGEDGKIYVAEDTNITYRWGGTGYVEISSSLALGETSSTAYRGDRGKTAYDHSQITTGNPHGTTAADVGARPSTWMPTTADIGAVPTTRTVNGKQLNANISLTAADVNAASKATYVSVTLPNTGWNNNQRVLTVNGVLADATKQLIVPCPQNATALDVWTAAGVKAIAQAANSLTFKCDSTPTASIPLYVAIIPIGS